MKSQSRIAILTTITLLFLGSALSQDLKYLEYDTDLIPPSVHKARREKVLQEIGDSSIAVFYAAPTRVRNADVDYQYRQDDNLLYLTGFREPDAILVLLPKGITLPNPADSSKTITTREILFVQRRDPRREQWTGRNYGPQGAMQLRGLDYAATNDMFQSMLPSFRTIPGLNLIYVSAFRPDLTGQIARLLQPLRALVEQKDSTLQVKDPGQILRRMRSIKSPEEITFLTKATDITVIAHNQAMMSLEPGMSEYEIQGVYEYVFRRMGSEFNGYPCIVGAGENSIVLHYESNRRQIRDGDLVLADCGAEYHGYSSDVTRTYPANGKFSKPQGEIYQIVLDASNTAIAMIKPGVPMMRISAAVDTVLMDGLMKLGLMKKRERRELARFYMHGLGHAVGLNVHDVGGFVLQPGMLTTIEPGLYVSETLEGIDPSYRNIGVRIEDTILVTAEGHKNLSEGSPREIADVEALMKRRGIGNQPLR